MKLDHVSTYGKNITSVYVCIYTKNILIFNMWHTNIAKKLTKKFPIFSTLKLYNHHHYHDYLKKPIRKECFLNKIALHYPRQFNKNLLRCFFSVKLLTA